MSGKKGANLKRQTIPCHYLCSSIKFIHLMAANYYAYMPLYANDKTLLVVHFKTTIRIQIWDSIFFISPFCETCFHVQLHCFWKYPIYTHQHVLISVHCAIETPFTGKKIWRCMGAKQIEAPKLERNYYCITLTQSGLDISKSNKMRPPRQSLHWKTGKDSLLRTK